MSQWNRSEDGSPSTAVSLKVAAGLVLAAAAARLLFAGMPNVAPVAAMALFGGAIMGRALFAFGIPLLALALSDLAVNAVMVGDPLAMPNPWVYGSFVLVGLLGFALRRRRTTGLLLGASMAGSLLFFALTNFGVWAQGLYYPMTAAGLATSFTAGLPFLSNTVLGDLFFNAALFGAYALLLRRQAIPATS